MICSIARNAASTGPSPAQTPCRFSPSFSRIKFANLAARGEEKGLRWNLRGTELNRAAGQPDFFQSGRPGAGFHHKFPAFVRRHDPGGIAQRHGFRPLRFKERVEIARTLDRLGVDQIELPALKGGKGDVLSNKTIASVVASARLSAAVGLTEEEAEAAWESVKAARRPGLHVMLPASSVQMEYLCHKKAPAHIGNFNGFHSVWLSFLVI